MIVTATDSAIRILIQIICRNLLKIKEKPLVSLSRGNTNAGHDTDFLWDSDRASTGRRQYQQTPSPCRKRHQLGRVVLE